MRQTLHLIFALTALSALGVAQVKSTAADADLPPGMPTSGGYEPPALSLDKVLSSDKELQEAMMRFYSSGDQEALRKFVISGATSGKVGYQLLLAEQYIPEQCTYQPDQDVPHCGTKGDEPPKVIFRTNPFGLPDSYEEAAHWLEHASQQGSGEASEILAQLITRMLANGHVTTYAAADSTKLHALARSQGFDVEPLYVTCYQLTSTVGQGLSVVDFPKPTELPVGMLPPLQPLSEPELAKIETVGLKGILRYQGGSGFGESTLLTRPEGPPVYVTVILNHNPQREFHLPIPAHLDAIYVQRDDSFISLPSDVPVLKRFISVMPQRPDYPQVSIFTQQMSGAYSGGTCGRF